MLVEIRTQGWGWIADAQGNGLGGRTVTLKKLDGTNATHYSSISGSSPSTASLTTNADGTIPRFIEPGPYTLDSPGQPQARVEATPGHKPTVINVADHMATDGSDVTAALTALRDVALSERRVLYIPEGAALGVTSSIVMQRDERIVGDHSPSWFGFDGAPNSGTPRASRIIALAAFPTNQPLIKGWQTSLTGAASVPAGCVLSGVCLEGVAGQAAGVRGIDLRGTVPDWHLEHVQVYRFPSDGIRSIGEGANPNQELFARDCVISHCAQGIVFASGATDHRFRDCIVHTCTGDGWVISSGTSALEILSPRAEWNGGNGYTIRSGDKVSLNNVITDRNFLHGMDISHQNGQPLQIIGAYLTRDGRGGAATNDTTRKAAVRIWNNGQWGCGPVILTGLATKVGADDGGGGYTSPNYGLWVSNDAYGLQFSGSLRGIEAGYRKDALTDVDALVLGDPNCRVDSGAIGASVITHVGLPTCTIATLPNAAKFPGVTVRVTDGASGQKIRTSDGTAWLNLG